MIGLINKKIRNRKGFTLIELIVVIAILGILALIAIPRFSGFTDRAKIQADEQYAAIVANTAKIALASGDIEGSGTITIKESSELEFDGLTLTDSAFAETFGEDGEEDMFASMIELKDLQYYEDIEIEIGADGETEIKPGSKQD